MAAAGKVLRIWRIRKREEECLYNVNKYTTDPLDDEHIHFNNVQQQQQQQQQTATERKQKKEEEFPSGWALWPHWRTAALNVRCDTASLFGFVRRRRRRRRRRSKGIWNFFQRDKNKNNVRAFNEPCRI